MSDTLKIQLNYLRGANIYQAPADEYTISLERGDGLPMCEEEVMAVLLAFKMNKNDLQRRRKVKAHG